MGEFKKSAGERAVSIQSRTKMGVRDSFERLDQSYLTDLVEKSRQGSSNAFAELFASVSDRQLLYLTRLFGDRNEALDALKEVFTTALRGLPSLTNAGLFMVWLSRISTIVYMERVDSKEADKGSITLSRLLNLPLAESQVMIMSNAQSISDSEIAIILNVGRSTVRRFIKLAYKHLANEAGAGKAISREEGRSGRQAGASERVQLTPVEVAETLESVFEACEREPNDLPIEALSSYAVYRKERFSLQRGIVIAALFVFVMLPLLFVVPVFTVNEEDEGYRGLPVYTIEVKSVLPVGKVLASIRNHSLPVYEAGAKEFTVEPTRNGTLTIDVELINRQRMASDLEVTAVDAKGPQLIDNKTEGERFIIKVEDDGIGVDYREIYAVGESGTIYYPVTANADDGVVFEYPAERWDIYIPDHIGNTLHLAISLK